jgi:hypothetical protein
VSVRRLPSVVDIEAHNRVDAEESVIGGILVHSRKFAEVSACVGPSDFHHPSLRAIYEAMVELDGASHPIDPVTVAERMRSTDTIDSLRAVGGTDYLTELTAKVVTTENLASHARIVRKRAVDRRKFAIAGDLQAALIRGDSDEIELFERRLADECSVETSTERAFPTMQIGDVPDLGLVRWLVQDLWADQACGFVGGKPKGGKSWLSVYIAICVASGKPVFGRYAVAQGRVVLFNAEDKPGRTKARIQMMCRALDVDVSTLDLHIISAHGLRLDHPEDVEKLRGTVKALRPTLVVLDPLRRLHSGDEDKAGDMDPLLDALRLMQREYACSVMVVHHVKKMDGDANGQALRGSSVFHAWLDSALYVTAKGKAWDDLRRVDVEHRDSENIEPFEWRLQKDTAIDGESVWLELGASESKDGAEVDENKVIQVLQSAGKPLTLGEISKQAGKRNGWSGPLVKNLVDKGVVTPVGSARYPVYGLAS